MYTDDITRAEVIYKNVSYSIKTITSYSLSDRYLSDPSRKNDIGFEFCMTTNDLAKNINDYPPEGTLPEVEIVFHDNNKHIKSIFSNGIITSYSNSQIDIVVSLDDLIKYDTYDNITEKKQSKSNLIRFTYIIESLSSRQNR
jgi:hypothetical protein